MKSLKLISAIILFSALFLPSLYALDGAPTGWWSDSEGNNYYGDPPSGSSSSSSSSSSSGSTYSESAERWRERWAAQREAAANRKENVRKQKAYDLNQKGIEFSSKDDFEKALEYYKKAAQVAPEDAVIQNNVQSVQGNMWNQKGLNYYAKNDMVNAKKMFELSLSFRPNDPTILANLADVENQLNYAQQETVKKQEVERQTNQVREKMADYSKELKGRTSGRQSSLDFQGAAAVPASGSNAPKVPLTEFENMKPVKPTLIQRGPLPKGGSSSASGQAGGLKISGASAAVGVLVGDGEMGSQGAGIGFDTAGAAGTGMQPFVLKGIERNEQDPEIPQSQITPELKGLVEKRERARGERRDLESKVEKLEQEGSGNPVDLVKMKDKISELKNNENFVNFSIKEKLEKAPEIKKGK